MKYFLCKFDVTFNDTELNFFYIDHGESKEKVMEKNKVEHDNDGLDTENSPVGGCVGGKCTELCNIYEITPTQKKFLNKVGIY